MERNTITKADIDMHSDYNDELSYLDGIKFNDIVGLGDISPTSIDYLPDEVVEPKGELSV